MIPDPKISREKWGFNGSRDTHSAVLLMGELCLVWAFGCELSVGNGIFCGCKISNEVESRAAGDQGSPSGISTL